MDFGAAWALQSSAGQRANAPMIPVYSKPPRRRYSTNLLGGTARTARPILKVLARLFRKKCQQRIRMRIEILVPIKPLACTKRRILIGADPNNAMLRWGCIHDFLNIVLPGLLVECINVIFHLRVEHGYRQTWNIVKRLGKSKPIFFLLRLQHTVNQIQSGFSANKTIGHIVRQCRLVGD